MEVIEIAIDKIGMSKMRWKREVKPERVNELADSILEEGLLHPILVRKVGKDYELIAGEHRKRATKKLGWKKIPAHVLDLDDVHSKLASIHENLRRYAPSSFEWAEGLAEEKDLHESIHGPTRRGRPPKVNVEALINEKTRREHGPLAAKKDLIPPPRRNYVKEAAKRFGVSERHVERQINKVQKLAPAAKVAWKAKAITDTQADELVKLSAQKQLALLPQLKQATREETRELVRAEGDGADIDRLARLLKEANPLAERLNLKLADVLANVEAKKIQIGGLGILKLGFELTVLHATIGKLMTIQEKGRTK